MVNIDDDNLKKSMRKQLKGTQKLAEMIGESEIECQDDNCGGDLEDLEPVENELKVKGVCSQCGAETTVNVNI